MEDCVSFVRGQPALASPLQIQQQSQQLRTPSDLHRPEQGDDPSRPLHEINSRGQQADPRSSISTRSASDIEIDPSLEGGLGASNQIAGDGPPSLPSLKSSGLLDSWNTPSDSPSVSGQISWNTASRARDTQAPPTSCQDQEDLEASRPVPSGMPVGMAWLANEPTTTTR
jgi:hypothetical protein